MDAPPASPRARKDSSRRVSEAVRSLRQNLDRKYLAQPEVVRPVSSKVRRQIAAFENPASALDRVEKASLSVRGTIAAFERSNSGANTIEPPSTNAPPMTPSRKAAIAARKVTRSQKLLVPEPNEDTGVPEPGQCSTPRVWPEVRHRKALFESNLSNNNTDLASQPNEKRNAKVSAGKKQKATSLRKNQRLESSAPAVNADDNGVEQVEGVNEQEPAADMMDVDEAPVSTPNPFIDDEEVEAAAVVPSSGIFAAVPASPARKSKRVASRTAPATIEPEETLATIADPTTENEHPENVALPKQTMTATDGVTHPAPTLTPRTPTKVVMPTSEQKAAIKTPVKSARKSARKLRAEDNSTAPTPGTPSKVAFPERMESALADAPEQQEIEEPVAPSSVRKSARKTRAAPTAVEEDSATLAPSVPTTPSKAKRAESASEVTAAAEETADEPPTTPRSVRKSARKPPAAAEIPATTPNRVTFAQRLESAALQEDTHEPAVVASPVRKSARKPQTPRAAANESETLSAGAGNPATPNRVTFAQRLESAALHDTQHEPAAVATPARKSARKSQTPRGGATETARPATTPSKVTFSRSLDDTSSDEDAAAEPRPKVPATPARVSARLAAASPYSARHAEPAFMPPATPAASTEITTEESFQTAPATPAAVAEKIAVTAPASTKRKRNARDGDNDKQDTTADAIAPAAESTTTAPTAEEASSSTEEAAAPANTTPAAQPPFVRKRRRMLEILPTPKKKTASSSLAPSSAARRIVQQHKNSVALSAVDSPPRNWVSTPVSPLGSSVVQMDVDGEDDEDDAEEGEEEGEGGWLLSVFFKAARKVGLL
ncbi:hypothetical protein HDU90_008745 [Geranomyces variabilis]|nr:hypothetical protein HDU90_008745 [Geranomyces variabilis]